MGSTEIWNLEQGQGYAFIGTIGATYFCEETQSSPDKPAMVQLVAMANDNVEGEVARACFDTFMGNGDVTDY